MKNFDSIINVVGQDKKQEVKEILRPRYVSILTNGGFKAVFADTGNKAVIMDIMNAFLPANRQVRDIIFMQTEHPSMAEDRKSVV